jgi:uncharacterized DUF497 family protein
MASFEWDEDKNRLNRQKHGVSFEEARLAFFDPRRVIAEDLGHGLGEQRYYCFGRVAGGVMTVRFTWRKGRVRIFGAGYGGKGARSMKSTGVRYTRGEIGQLRVIDDFLPPPEALVPQEEHVKVTLSLSRRSVDFFKREGKKRRVPYQRMIRALVDHYTTRQAGRK